MDIRDRLSPNFDERPAGIPIDMLVIHYTGMETFDAALDRLCDGAAKVSAHYAISMDGIVYRLVPEARRAWHAGVSSWRGHTDVNGRSIGIELENPGHEFGYQEFSEPQMSALESLASDILGRHPIPARNVVGHSDVAPTRKQDPGEKFDWRRLARAGIGNWPAHPEAMDADETVDNVVDGLAAYGYDTSDVLAATAAFQAHFSYKRVIKHTDKETRRILYLLLAHMSENQK